jgi:hypothetical protein
MIADELRRQCDIFIDLIAMKPQISRDPKERPASGEPRNRSSQFRERSAGGELRTASTFRESL